MGFEDQIFGINSLSGNFGSSEKIDATRVGTGDINNSEFETLDNASGNLQLQINGKAPLSHTHPFTDITGTATIGQGGTGATTAMQARANLNVPRAHAFGVSYPCWAGSAAGTDTYTASVTAGGASAMLVGDLVNGTLVRLSFANSNTTTTTLNIDSTGAKPMYKGNSAITTAGDIAPNTIYEFVYSTIPVSGGCWQLIRTALNTNDLNGVLSIPHGGTNASDANTARTNLIAHPLHFQTHGRNLLGIPLQQSRAGLVNPYQDAGSPAAITSSSNLNASGGFCWQLAGTTATGTRTLVLHNGAGPTQVPINVNNSYNFSIWAKSSLTMVAQFVCYNSAGVTTGTISSPATDFSGINGNTVPWNLTSAVWPANTVYATFQLVFTLTGSSVTVQFGNPDMQRQADLTKDVTGILPVGNGGAGINLSTTGGTGMVVKQKTAGGNFSVEALTPNDIGVPLYAGVTSGTGSAYTATIANLSNQTQGTFLAVSLHTANTIAGPTLNVNSLGALPVYKGGQPAAIGTLGPSSQGYVVVGYSALPTPCWNVYNTGAIDASEIISGLLPVNRGGTGQGAAGLAAANAIGAQALSYQGGSGNLIHQALNDRIGGQNPWNDTTPISGDTFVQQTGQSGVPGGINWRLTTSATAGSRIKTIDYAKIPVDTSRSYIFKLAISSNPVAGVTAGLRCYDASGNFIASRNPLNGNVTTTLTSYAYTFTGEGSGNSNFAIGTAYVIPFVYVSAVSTVFTWNFPELRMIPLVSELPSGTSNAVALGLQPLGYQATNGSLLNQSLQDRLAGVNPWADYPAGSLVLISGDTLTQVNGQATASGLLWKLATSSTAGNRYQRYQYALIPIDTSRSYNFRVFAKADTAPGVFGLCYQAYNSSGALISNRVVFNITSLTTTLTSYSATVTGESGAASANFPVGTTYICVYYTSTSASNNIYFTTPEIYQLPSQIEGIQTLSYQGSGSNLIQQSLNDRINNINPWTDASAIAGDVLTLVSGQSVPGGVIYRWTTSATAGGRIKSLALGKIPVDTSRVYNIKISALASASALFYMGFYFYNSSGALLGGHYAVQQSALTTTMTDFSAIVSGVGTGATNHISGAAYVVPVVYTSTVSVSIDFTIPEMYLVPLLIEGIQPQSFQAGNGNLVHQALNDRLQGQIPWADVITFAGDSLTLLTGQTIPGSVLFRWTAGTSAGVRVKKISNCKIPVDTSRTFNLRISALSNPAGAVFQYGVYCYNSSGTLLGFKYPGGSLTLTTTLTAYSSSMTGEGSGSTNFFVGTSYVEFVLYQNTASAVVDFAFPEFRVIGLPQDQPTGTVNQIAMGAQAYTYQRDGGVLADQPMVEKQAGIIPWVDYTAVAGDTLALLTGQTGIPGSIGYRWTTSSTAGGRIKRIPSFIPVDTTRSYTFKITALASVTTTINCGFMCYDSTGTALGARYPASSTALTTSYQTFTGTMSGTGAGQTNFISGTAYVSPVVQTPTVSTVMDFGFPEIRLIPILSDLPTVWAGTTGGTAYAYTVSSTNINSLVAGQRITIVPHITNWAPPGNSITLALNGGTAIAIWQNGTYAGPGVLQINMPTTLIYDGTRWHIIESANMPQPRFVGGRNLVNLPNPYSHSNGTYSLATHANPWYVRDPADNIYKESISGVFSCAPVQDSTMPMGNTYRMTVTGLSSACSVRLLDCIFPTVNGRFYRGRISLKLVSGTVSALYIGTDIINGTTAPISNSWWLMAGTAFSNSTWTDIIDKFILPGGNSLQPTFLIPAGTYTLDFTVHEIVECIVPEGIWGDGSGGDVVINSGTTFLSAPAYYRNLTITGAAILQAGGYPVFVSGILDITGVTGTGGISWGGQSAEGNGNAGSASTGGSVSTILASALLGGTGFGATAGASGTTGIGSQAVANGGVTPSNGGGPGASGAGGTGTSGAGGAAGSPGSVAGATQISFPTINMLRGTALILGGGGGRGGSSGSGDGTNSGGGGGGGGQGGGLGLLFARTINRSSSTPSGAIRCNGGAGGAGGTPTTGNCGGGGGGGGAGAGSPTIVFGQILGASATNLITANGGAGGNGGSAVGTGTAGSFGYGGGSGRITLINMSTNVITVSAGDPNSNAGLQAGKVNQVTL